MKRVAAFSSFGVTALVLAFIVVLGFRIGGAQGAPTANTPGTLGATSEAHFAFLGISRGDVARVHVVNLSPDLANPSLRFLVMFIDQRGILIKPEQACDVRTGETCSVTLTRAECLTLDANGRDRCDFRALVVPETLPCPALNADGGVSTDPRWSADLEIAERRDGGVSTKLVLNPSLVLAMPVAVCTNPNPDGGGGNPGGGNPDGGVVNPDGGVVNPDGGAVTGIVP